MFAMPREKPTTRGWPKVEGCRRYILVDTDTCCPTPFSDVTVAVLSAPRAGS